MKKSWLRAEMENGYVFRKLDERAKVFIEYGPAEKAWAPVKAENYLMLGCFWVSGRFKGHGYGKKLLQMAEQEAADQGKYGLVTVAGKKKFHFMSDTKWLLRQGFEVVSETSTGFVLLTKKRESTAPDPVFLDIAMKGESEVKEGLVAYYSNRCPYTEYHVNQELKKTAEKRGLDLRIIHLQSAEDARQCPSPATLFSLFYNGKFATTDVSVCLDSRYDRIMNKL
jgi:hypothetical protein